MYDSTSKESESKPWNITFYDYNSHTMDPELSKKYEFIHVTSSTSGKIVTMNRKTGGFIWEKLDIKSPIIAIFLLSRDGFLSVPFTTVGDDVIDKVVAYSKSDGNSDFKLYETVFVGESKGETFRGDTLYAIPSYVDDNTPTIRRNAMNLLDGPNSKNSDTRYSSADSNRRSSKRNYIIFGHYENPTDETVFDTIGSKDHDKQLSVRSDKSIWLKTEENEENLSEVDDNKIIMPDDTKMRNRNIVIKPNNSSSSTVKTDEIVENKKKYGFLKTWTLKVKHWFDNEENKILKLAMVILCGCFITMFWYFQARIHELRQQSQNGSKTNVPRSTDSNRSYGDESLDGEYCEIIILVIVVDIRLIVDFVYRMICNH